jgi:peptidoglycan/xylan/chitin deacetylase (PgdA/CDA1 family)
MAPKRIISLVILAFLVVMSAAAYAQHSASGDEVIYVAITIDTERDYPPYMDTFRGIDEGLPLLEGLLEAHDISATFFVTGRVAQERPEAVYRLSLDHEIGCHSLNHDVALYTLPYDELESRVSEATGLIEQLIGRDVVSFRSPFHSGSTELMHILESLGYTTEGSATKLSSYPYHPSADDWEVAGDMDILRVPVSNGPSYLYTFFYYDSSLIDGYEHALSEQEGRNVKLVVIGLHPWEFCEMQTGHAGWDRVCGNKTYAMLSELLDYLDGQPVEYVTYSEIPGLFD